MQRADAPGRRHFLRLRQQPVGTSRLDLVGEPPRFGLAVGAAVRGDPVVAATWIVFRGLARALDQLLVQSRANAR